MTHLGYKKITVDNWNEPDIISTNFFHRPGTEGEINHITGDEWVEEILQYNLKDNVPLEIRKLYEVARSAIIYGYYFYPLYTLAGQQLFRISEAAITAKCVEIKAPKKIKTFNERIKYLVKTEIIKVQDEEVWHAVRELRNTSSHPESQSIFDPGSVIGMLMRTTEIINSLYNSGE